MHRVRRSALCCYLSAYGKKAEILAETERKIRLTFKLSVATCWLVISIILAASAAQAQPYYCVAGVISASDVDYPSYTNTGVFPDWPDQNPGCNAATSYPISEASGLAPQIAVPMYRVVGPGTAQEFDQNGFLVNWQQYVVNGILSPTACLNMAWSYSPADTFFTTLTPPAQMTVILNGIAIKTIQVPGIPAGGPRDAGVVVPYHCEEISTQYIKFARRVPGQRSTCAGGASTCGVNSFEVIDDRDPSNPASFGILWFGVTTLSVKAMAPVVLVHGWNSGPWTWGPRAGRCECLWC